MRFEKLNISRKLYNHTRLLWDLYVDPRAPKSYKWGVWFLFLYLLFPLDIIPDFIPLLGQIDDFLIIVLGLKLLTRLCPPELVAEHRARIEKDYPSQS